MAGQPCWQTSSRVLETGAVLALADMTLTTDPFTGNRYAFGAGNPITNIELDGHTQCDAGYCPTQRQTQQVTGIMAAKSGFRVQLRS